MPRDISLEEKQIWAARTATGVALVAVRGEVASELVGAELVILDSSAGERAVARLIGPVAGQVAGDVDWRVEARYRLDPAGEPLSALAGPAIPEPPPGHDWGALGLLEGLETRVRPLGDLVPIDALALARGSSGHRIGEEARWLTLAPGDTMTAEGRAATVLFIDRRKRIVEVDVDGQTRTVDLDDLTTEETTA